MLPRNFCLVAPIVLLSIVRVAPAAQYTITNLGSLGGGYAEGYAINSHGQVAGESKADDNNIHAFITTTPGVINAATDDLGILAGHGSYGRGINDAGPGPGGMLIRIGIEIKIMTSINGEAP